VLESHPRGVSHQSRTGLIFDVRTNLHRFTLLKSRTRLQNSKRHDCDRAFFWGGLPSVGW